MTQHFLQIALLGLGQWVIDGAVKQPQLARELITGTDNAVRIHTRVHWSIPGTSGVASSPEWHDIQHEFLLFANTIATQEDGLY